MKKLILTIFLILISTITFADTLKVYIADYVFLPKIAYIRPGDTIIWYNYSRMNMPHNVYNNHGIFRSKVMKKGSKFSHKFNVKGTYEYLCTLHPKMIGKVVVK